MFKLVAVFIGIMAGLIIADLVTSGASTAFIDSFLK